MEIIINECWLCEKDKKVNENFEILKRKWFTEN